jgi:outer membrane lipoprotein
MHQRNLQAMTLLCLAMLAGGCAQSPVARNVDNIAPHGPAHVLSGESYPGDRVVWGGRIVAVENHARHTELIIASYPLDRSDRPRVREPAGVRFVLVEPRFLEPVEWAPGRFVTALGTVAGTQDRTTGEHVHPHPVLESERLHLWPADPATWQTRTGISLGVGIRL